jgi:hypothetical protein
MIDDSALFHAAEAYDPAKAREYYLRTRKLKGRKKGSQDEPAGDRQKGTAAIAKVKKAAAPTKSGEARRAEIAAEVTRLRGRLEKLKKALAALVSDAKGRTGAKDDKSKPGAKDSKDSKGASKLSAADKKKAAERSKKWREKHKDKTPEQQVTALKEQIKDIKAKLKAAIAKAKEGQSSSKSKPKTAVKGR